MGGTWRDRRAPDLTLPVRFRGEKDLPQLSKLGHFLKGSSAALGLQKVKASCEKIQHYGNLRTADGKGDIGEEEALQLIESLLDQTRKEYAEVGITSCSAALQLTISNL